MSTFHPVYWVRSTTYGLYLYRIDSALPSNNDIGVGFFEGGKLIVVSLNETSLRFSPRSSDSYAYTGYFSYQMTNGKTCRELTEAHATTVNDGINSAAGYCMAYQAPNDIEQRAWALPSFHEWYCIYNHIEDINMALQKKGAPIISNTSYWTCNVAVERGVFYVKNYGDFNWNSWNPPTRYTVRPIIVL